MLRIISHTSSERRERQREREWESGKVGNRETANGLSRGTFASAKILCCFNT